MKPNLEVVSIGNFMDRLGETVHSHFADSKAKLKLDYRRRHRVKADPEQLLRVLLNLLDNAYQAVGKAGTVTVTVKELDPNGGRRIQFSVHNDGPTIPEEDLKNLSTPYFTKRKDGTGLGLTIAKKIVEEHGGALAWYSTPETGTCFSFTLPVAEGEEKCPQLRTVTQDEKTFDEIRDRNILIFDDEKIVRDHWSAHAKKVGFHTVLDFKSWEDFVRQDGYKFVDQHTVAFVDIHFNGSRHDGLEIAKSLKKIGVTKIYAITGDIETAKESDLFTQVFGKEIPTNFRSLVGLADQK
jgi:CheY-like chemotaxis protein